jgi:AraC-like DNA-binding protein
MAYDRLYLLMFSVNLTYVVVALYGWALKVFYVPAAYKEVFGQLYPARYSLANLFMMQVVELPFIFFMGRPEVLFLVNASALLFITSYLIVLIKGYFFLDFYTAPRLLQLQHPVIICWIALMLPVLGVIKFTPTYKTIMTIVVLLVALGYIVQLDRCRLRLVKEIREIDEDEFSSADDFPIKFAKSIKWLPFIVCMLLIATFLLNSYWAKMVRDIVFIIINVWFAIVSLNPHRNAKKLPRELKKKDIGNNAESSTKYRLSDKYCQETEKKLVETIRNKKLYLEEHFTMNDLTDIMLINKNYLSEVIARSEYQSFYKLINTLRIEHACQLLQEDPTIKLEQVALASGFLSGSAFSQVFKRLMNVSPKEYIGKIHAK